MIMDKSILNSIGGISSKSAEEWGRGWDDSQKSYPEDGVYFLQEEYLREIADVTRLRAEARPAFFESGEKMRNSEALSRLAWHGHWLAHLTKREERNGVPFHSNDPSSRAPEGCTFFMGIVIMADLPRLKAYYQSRGISFSILSDTMTSFDVWAEDYHDHKGVWGCDHVWVCQGIIPNLFRLGRLEFQFAEYHGTFTVYRRKGARTLVVFAPDGAKITDSGYFCQKDQSPDFIATLKEDANSITGYPANPDGRFAYEPVTLDFAEWEPAFVAGDPMLNVHIPAAAPLEGELTTRSFDMAREFFAKYFPLFKFKGFQCGSWLLDSSLPNFIPETSNIVQFQRNFTLFPQSDGTEWQTRERVFGDPDLPLDKVPQRTSLQRIVKQQILAGHRFRSGSGIILR